MVFVEPRFAICNKEHKIGDIPLRRPKVFIFKVKGLIIVINFELQGPQNFSRL